MDRGTFMGVITAILLIAYLGIVVWTFSRERKSEFDAAARYPLLEDGSF